MSCACWFPEAPHHLAPALGGRINLHAIKDARGPKDPRSNTSGDLTFTCTEASLRLLMMYLTPTVLLSCTFTTRASPPSLLTPGHCLSATTTSWSTENVVTIACRADATAMLKSPVDQLLLGRHLGGIAAESLRWGTYIGQGGFCFADPSQTQIEIGRPVSTSWCVSVPDPLCWRFSTIGLVSVQPNCSHRRTHHLIAGR